MKFGVKDFGGIVPRVDSELLPKKNGVTVHNAKIKSGKLVPIKSSANVGSIAANQKELFLWRRDDDTTKFLSFPHKASVAESPIAGDQHSRVYISQETGLPQVMFHDIYLVPMEFTHSIKIPKPSSFTVEDSPEFEYMTEAEDFLRIVTLKNGELLTADTTPISIAPQNITNIITNKRWEIFHDYDVKDDTDASYEVFLSVKVKTVDGTEKYLWVRKPVATGLVIDPTTNITELEYAPNKNRIYSEQAIRWGVKIDESNSLTTSITGGVLALDNQSYLFWRGISDGSLTLRVGDSDVYVQTIDLTTATTMDMVASLIETKLRSAGGDISAISVIYDSVIKCFKVSNSAKPTYINGFSDGVSGTSLTLLMKLTADTMLNIEKSEANQNNIRVSGVVNIMTDFKTAPEISYPYYVQTFVTKWGEESSPSPISEALTRQAGSDVKVGVGIAYLGSINEAIIRGVNALIIYRTVDVGNGNAEYKRVAKISIYSDTDDADSFGQYHEVDEIVILIDGNMNPYLAKKPAIPTDFFAGWPLVRPGEPLYILDTISDVDTSTTLTTSYDIDDNLRGMKLMPNNSMVGYVGPMFHMSEPNVPYSWPYAYQHKMRWDIVAVENSGTDIVVLTKGHPYVLSGSDPKRLQKSMLSLRQPCVSEKGSCQIQNAVFYASPDGIVMIRGAYAVLATEKYMKPEDWQKLNPTTMRFVPHDGAIYIFNEDEVTETLVFDIDDGLSAMTTIDTKSACVCSDILTDSLYYGDGLEIKQFDSGSTDQTITWKSKMIVKDKPFNFMNCRIRRKANAPLTLTLFANGVLVYTGVGYTAQEFLLPRLRMETNWQIQIECASKIDTVEFASSLKSLNGSWTDER